jgi:hypothetical protein
VLHPDDLLGVVDLLDEQVDLRGGGRLREDDRRLDPAEEVALQQGGQLGEERRDVFVEERLILLVLGRVQQLDQDLRGPLDRADGRGARRDGRVVLDHDLDVRPLGQVGDRLVHQAADQLAIHADDAGRHVAEGGILGVRQPATRLGELLEGVLQQRLGAGVFEDLGGLLRLHLLLVDDAGLVRLLLVVARLVGVVLGGRLALLGRGLAGITLSERDRRREAEREQGDGETPRRQPRGERLDHDRQPSEKDVRRPAARNRRRVDA